MTESTAKAAYRWSIGALARRMRSTGEISEGLTRRGYPPEVVRQVVEDLTARGYLDDAQFALSWVESRAANRNYGRIRLLRELRDKGIPDSLAHRAMDERLPPDRESELAITAVEKKMRTLRKSGREGREALYRFLTSRGFTGRAISEALKHYSNKETQV